MTEDFVPLGLPWGWGVAIGNSGYFAMQVEPDGRWSSRAGPFEKLGTAIAWVYETEHGANGEYRMKWPEVDELRDILKEAYADKEALPTEPKQYTRYVEELNRLSKWIEKLDHILEGRYGA